MILYDDYGDGKDLEDLLVIDPSDTCDHSYKGAFALHFFRLVSHLKPPFVSGNYIG